MADAPVLVVTSVDDATADPVTQRLFERGVPVVRLDPADFLGAAARMSARFGSRGMSGRVCTASREVELRGVRAAWWRRPTPYRARAGWQEQIARFAVNEAGIGFGGVLAALPDCLWVNHPWRNHAAEHKPAQLDTAAACGFTVPETLITNEVDEARAFADAFGPVVYKPLRHAVLPAADGRDGMIWVGPVVSASLDESVAGTAHMFQAEVNKVADVRVTVVGRWVFAVRIDGGLLDWRADYDALTYTRIPCPPEVERAIHRYMASFGLLFGAFDFALTAAGEWVFLECNPNGQWAWIAEQEDAVADALADLLEKGRA
ncbi:ATP-grasp ribosomal peptide maturase [Nonomuraea sp. NPDC048916]|uniref:ATP-grasp ribosomal peptide maturase n=1 Tax=Nonomuraea sp. NPDC048916 TaxID=3154232 RepID=UPI0033C75E49